jgi:hypothetical protein
MKIQCACGAKYALDVVPGMPPVTFVCPSCGQDYSAYVNDLIRRELGQPAVSAPAQPPPPAISAPAAPAPPAGSRLKISRGHEPAAPAPAPAQVPASKYCPKHHTELATGQCVICHTPTCPKCMETFGEYCSAFCKNKVEGHSMTAPAFTGSRFVAEHEFRRKAGTIGGIVGVVLAAVLGFWFWYAWIGSVPKVKFSVPFDAVSHTGISWINGDEIVFLHGGTLARYNWQTKQKIWSVDLVNTQEVDAILKAEDEERADEARHGEDTSGGIQLPSYRQKYARIGLESALLLQGSGKNVWISKGNTLTHYDWDTGNVLQQITVTNGLEQLAQHGDEFLALGRGADGVQSVTHISMDDGQMSTEEFVGANAPVVVVQNAPRVAADNGGGLPLSPNEANRPMNPQRVAQEAQGMSYAGRLALPALLGNSEHNRQINAEIAEEDGRARAPQQARPVTPPETTDVKNFNLVPDGDSYLGFAAHMTQQNIVQRDAMRAPSGDNALNSPDLGSANEQKAINEQLNDIQRTTGGGTVSEDESHYQVTIRRLNSATPDWTGEVIGPPQLFPLATVNVVAAGKTLIALDKSDKLLWQAQTTYDITGGDGQSFQSPFGAGPCVEHNGTLYVFDQAVLTAYDAASGNVRWRLPSVGVVGLFFDDKGALYINTTTGNPDDIKYSREIDVNKATLAVVMKINPDTGVKIWSTTPGAYISYLSGDFIYAYESYDSGDKEDQMSETMAELQKPPFTKIMRINPSNGRTMWEHDIDRAAVDVQFDKNVISIVLKKEVEVLRFFTL